MCQQFSNNSVSLYTLSKKFIISSKNAPTSRTLAGTVQIPITLPDTSASDLNENIVCFNCSFRSGCILLRTQYLIFVSSHKQRKRILKTNGVPLTTNKSAVRGQYETRLFCSPEHQRRFSAAVLRPCETCTSGRSSLPSSFAPVLASSFIQKAS